MDRYPGLRSGCTRLLTKHTRATWVLRPCDTRPLICSALQCFVISTFLSELCATPHNIRSISPRTITLRRMELVCTPSIWYRMICSIIMGTAIEKGELTTEWGSFVRVCCGPKTAPSCHQELAEVVKIYLWASGDFTGLPAKTNILLSHQTPLCFLCRTKETTRQRNPIVA